MIATAAFGFPVLFVIYLCESGVRHHIPVRNVVLAAVVGVALGAGWAWIAGFVFADGYGATLVPQTGVGHTLLYALAIPIGEALLMLVPALVVRVLDKSTRESLDGFLDRCAGGDRLHRGGDPDAAGAAVGDGAGGRGPIARRARRRGRDPGCGHAFGQCGGRRHLRCRTVVHPARRRFAPAARLPRPSLAAVLVAIGLFVASGLLDVSPFSNNLYLGGYLLIAVLALLALRIALQAALLHEAHDDPGPDGQLPCADCDHVVPRMAFCPNCGVATRARVPDGSRTAQPVRRSTYARVLLTAVAGVGVAAAGCRRSDRADHSCRRTLCVPA